MQKELSKTKNKRIEDYFLACVDTQVDLMTLLADRQLFGYLESFKIITFM